MLELRHTLDLLGVTRCHRSEQCGPSDGGYEMPCEARERRRAGPRGGQRLDRHADVDRPVLESNPDGSLEAWPLAADDVRDLIRPLLEGCGERGGRSRLVAFVV